METAPQPAVCGLVTTAVPPETRNRHVLTSHERGTALHAYARLGSCWPRVSAPSPACAPCRSRPRRKPLRRATQLSLVFILATWQVQSYLSAFPLNSVAWAMANMRRERYYYPPFVIECACAKLWGFFSSICVALCWVSVFFRDLYGAECFSSCACEFHSEHYQRDYFFLQVLKKRCEFYEDFSLILFLPPTPSNCATAN